MQVKVCWSVRKGGKWFAFPNVEFRSVLSRVTRPSNTSTPLDRGCRASCQHAKSCVERSSAVPSNPSSILLPLSQLMCSIRQFPTLSGSLSTLYSPSSSVSATGYRRGCSGPVLRTFVRQGPSWYPKINRRQNFGTAV